MLYRLAELLLPHYSGFRVFTYLTLRGILAALTALLIALLVGPWMIRSLAARQIGQNVRELGPQSHLSKQGTPTMGGALILVAMLGSTLLWADLTNRYVWIVTGVTAAFGLLLGACANTSYVVRDTALPQDLDVERVNILNKPGEVHSLSAGPEGSQHLFDSAA